LSSHVPVDCFLPPIFQILLECSDLFELLGLSVRIIILQGGRQVAVLDRQAMTPADLLSRIYAAEVA
jgi:ABC-type sugar transport system ATPase subunit